MKPSALLTDSSKWTKYTTARDAGGNPVGVWNPAAVKWDLLGALARQTAMPTKQAETHIRQTEVWGIWVDDNAKAEFKSQRTLADFNDTTSFEWLALALRQANL